MTTPAAPVTPVATREAQIALAQAYAVFPEARWRAAGADDSDILNLRAAWDAHDVEWQGEEAKAVESVDLGTLAANLADFRASDPVAAVAASSPYGGSIDEVKAAVGDDPAKAREAIEYETGPSGKSRTRLVEHLEKVAAGGGGHLGEAATDLT